MLHISRPMYVSCDVIFPAMLSISSKAQQQLRPNKIQFCKVKFSSKNLHCNDFITYFSKNKLWTKNVQCNGFIAHVLKLSWLHD